MTVSVLRPSFGRLSDTAQWVLQVQFVPFPIGFEEGEEPGVGGICLVL